APSQVQVLDNQFAPFSPLFEQSLLIKHNYSSGASVHVEGNTFTGHTVGILSGNSANVTIVDNVFTPAANNFVNVLSDTRFPTASTAPHPPVPPATTFTNAVTAQGNTFDSGGFTGGPGIGFFDRNADPNPFSPPASIVLGGAGTLANTFDSGLAYFIKLDA